MKKDFLNYGIIFTLVLFWGCSKSSSIDNNSMGEVETTFSARPINCPPGYRPVWVYRFDEFKFHRPKLDCNSGFWFCTKGGEWVEECKKNTTLAYISDHIATVYARSLPEGQIEFHFPIALKDLPYYTEEELQTFNVDEELTIRDGVTLKTGDYPVTETENELVVIVDIL